MQITINNQQFKRGFLEQICKISDSAVIKIESGYINCICSSPDNSIILYSRLKIKTEEIISPVTLNVGDIKKLIRAFDCVDSEDLTFTVKNNNINYSDTNVQFKYHLLEDGIITQPKINVQKLEELDFNCSFTLTDKALTELLKGSTFSSDSNKVYLSSVGKSLKGNLTDKTKFNIDNFELNISNDFEGQELKDLCLNFEVFRTLSASKFNTLKCKISSKLGVILFLFENSNIVSKYIVSALTK
jgi:hypothetical protein